MSTEVVRHRPDEPAKKQPSGRVAKKVAPRKAAKKAAPKKAAKKAAAKKAAKKVAKKVPPPEKAAEKAARGARRSSRQGHARPRLGLPQLPAPSADPVVVLGLREPFTAADLRRAWRVFAARHHPDQGGDAVTFNRGRAAYDELRDALS